MNTIFKFLALSVSLLGGYASAQSCSGALNDMIMAAGSGNKTYMTVMSHQANGIDVYSGKHLSTTGLEAKLLWSGTWMTSAITGGVNGRAQFIDRPNTSATPSTQPFSVRTADMEVFDFYMDASNMWIYDSTWSYWITISGITCANGVITGFGTPIGNWNGTNRALYIFSFSFAP